MNKKNIETNIKWRCTPCLPLGKRVSHSIRHYWDKNN